MGTRLFFLLLTATMLLSCSTKRHVEYVDREVVKYSTKIAHDTLINNVRDSIFYAVYTKGDTIYETKYVERVTFKDVIVTIRDTIFIDQKATKTQETMVEKLKTPKWCYYCLAFCIIFVIFAAIKVYRWLR